MNKGTVNYYYGVMSCGKSTHLLQKSFNFKSHGFDVITLVSSLDDRFGTGKITSRIGISSDAMIIPNGDYTIFEEVENMVKSSTKFGAIFVDECQFLDKKSIDMLCEIADNYGVDVHCYGIKTDFSTDVFSGSLRLFEVADNSEELPSICACGSKAIINARLVDSTEKVLIGAEDMYKSMCRVCYKQFIKCKPKKD